MPGVSFFAYGTPRWGVNVAAGDIDGDGFEEILTGAGPGAIYGPHVRAFNHDGTPPVTADPAVNFFAYETLRWGVNVSTGDIDGDGVDEIITGAGPGEIFGCHVRAFNYDGESVTPMPNVSFIPFSYDFGAQVGSTDLDGDGADEIIVAPGPDADAPCKIRFFTLNVEGQIESVNSVRPFPDLTHGGRVAGGQFFSVGGQ